jgi:hypothetical protein
VRHPGHDGLAELLHGDIEGCGAGGRGGLEQATQVAGLDVGEHGEGLDGLVVVTDEVDGRVEVGADVVGVERLEAIDIGREGGRVGVKATHGNGRVGYYFSKKIANSIQMELEIVQRYCEKETTQRSS